MKCLHCETEIGEMPHYRVLHNADDWHFCGRRCLVEYVAPEINKAIVPSHWIPTPDENERMAQ